MLLSAESPQLLQPIRPSRACDSDVGRAVRRECRRVQPTSASEALGDQWHCMPEEPTVPAQFMGRTAPALPW
jgi:hypothetical protein